jgi:alkylhydroperoxidase/carboxymuconolactone decarboxylase family protein YurZ
MTSEDSAYDRGMKVRREVLGDEHVDRAIGRTTEFTADFQDFITRYAWGEIWSRPGLSRWAASTSWSYTYARPSATA